MKDCDIELALTHCSEGDVEALTNLLSEGYEIDDRSSNGWGLVVHSDLEGNMGSFDEQISDFLLGVMPIRKFIEKSPSVLRVAIFNKKATCTIDIGNFELMVALKIRLEISVYPSK